MTALVPHAEALPRRLGGRMPDLVLAPEHLMDGLADWGVPLGVVLGAAPPVGGPFAAVRGPDPPLEPVLSDCERAGIPYLAPSLNILSAGRSTIAVLTTPPAAGPG